MADPVAFLSLADTDRLVALLGAWLPEGTDLVSVEGQAGCLVIKPCKSFGGAGNTAPAVAEETNPVPAVEPALNGSYSYKEQMLKLLTTGDFTGQEIHQQLGWPLNKRNMPGRAYDCYNGLKEEYDLKSYRKGGRTYYGLADV